MNRGAALRPQSNGHVILKLGRFCRADKPPFHGNSRPLAALRMTSVKRLRKKQELTSCSTALAKQRFGFSLSNEKAGQIASLNSPGHKIVPIALWPERYVALDWSKQGVAVFRRGHNDVYRPMVVRQKGPRLDQRH